MKKIIHITHSMEIGGLERVVLGLSNELKEQGHSVSICCLAGEGALGQEAEPTGINLMALGKGVGVNYRLVLTIAGIIRRGMFDVVHTHNEAGLIYGVPGALLAGKCVTVHTEHGKEPGYENRTAFHWVERVLLRKVDHAVAVSGKLRGEICRTLRISERNVSVIPNGVSIDNYSCAAARSGVRRALGFDGTEFVVGNVARLVPLKNHRFLLRIFKEIVSDFPSARLVLVGDGPLMEDLKAYCCRSGLSESVIFLGERTDVPKYLSTFDLFVLPSLTEGMSMTLLEAMAAGIPVIASEVGGNPEVVEDGKTGLLIPVNDGPAWIRGIKELIVDGVKRKSFSLAGRERVSDKFSLQKMVENYRSLYEKKGT